MKRSTLHIGHAEYRSVLEESLEALSVNHKDPHAHTSLLLFDCFHVLSDESFADHFRLSFEDIQVIQYIRAGAFVLPFGERAAVEDSVDDLPAFYKPWIALASAKATPEDLRSFIHGDEYVKPFAEHIMWMEQLHEQRLPSEITEWRENLLALPPGLFRICLARLYRRDLSAMTPKVAGILARFHRKTIGYLEYTMMYWMNYLCDCRLPPDRSTEDAFTADSQVLSALRMLEFTAERIKLQQAVSDSLLDIVNTSIASLETAVYRDE
ncbi:MAG: hypothetical protein MUC47_11880 [Candidatus Kapabacteria bacterium]|jgi:hypothetical protein|nr:hypothetical protein [Candidatus Kapabacteria bacterium]